MLDVHIVWALADFGRSATQVRRGRPPAHADDARVVVRWTVGTGGDNHQRAARVAHELADVLEREEHGAAVRGGLQNIILVFDHGCIALQIRVQVHRGEVRTLLVQHVLKQHPYTVSCACCGMHHWRSWRKWQCHIIGDRSRLLLVIHHVTAGSQ